MAAPSRNTRQKAAASVKKTKLNNRSHIMSRYGCISLVLMAATIGIISKLAYTTIIEAHAWNARAARDMAKTSPIYPERGNILASNGNILACNQTLYDIRIDCRHPRLALKALASAEKWRMLDSLADSLDRHFPRNKFIFENADSMERYSWRTFINKEFKKPEDSRRKTITIGNKLTEADFDLIRNFPFFKSIKGKGRALPVYAEDHVVRKYPFGEMARLSIGRVYNDSATNQIHGYAGLEKALDSLLYGKQGRAKTVAMTNGFSGWVDIPAKRGYDILSTIDIDIQDILEAELLNMCDSVGAEWGTAIIMEVATGEIKAISNVERGDDGRYIEAMNRAVLPFEPGSVMKPISLMVAFEDGLVKKNTDMVDCSPFMQTSDHAGGGMKSMRQVIATSSNTGIARVIFRGYEKEPQKYRERLASMGFFERMNSGIGGEQVPRIPILYAQNPRTGQPITMTARHLDLARQAYGYNTEIPPLYTLSYYNAIANKGRYVRPHLVRALRDEDGRDSVLKIDYIRDPLCSPHTAQQVKECLYDVVWDNRGTARALQDDRVTVCGKTGTAIPYDYERLKAYDHSKRRFAFAGFFPYEEPKYSCMVLMTAPAGSTSAARGSGKVLLNVALKLYARGMLTDPSPFDLSPVSGAAQLYASIADNVTNLIETLGLRGARKLRSNPLPTPGKMPDPTGLDLQSAIALLEKSGLDVTSIQGTGYVTQVIPAPGTPVKKGSKAALHLSWK